LKIFSGKDGSTPWKKLARKPMQTHGPSLLLPLPLGHRDAMRCPRGSIQTKSSLEVFLYSVISEHFKLHVHQAVAST